MKKFTKLFLSCAAVAAVTAAVATSAMAAEKTLTATYAADGNVGKVTISDYAGEDATKTIVVLKPGASRTNIATTDILQIDQGASFTSVTIPKLNEEDSENNTDKGTYTVLMGGTTGDIYVGTFTIGAEAVLVGDVDDNKRITQTDAVSILQYAAGDTTAIASELLGRAAYCDGNKRVTQTDAVNVLQYAAGDTNQDYVGKTLVIPQ